jgi:3-methyladenine DNA glycosylase AlkD
MNFEPLYSRLEKEILALDTSEKKPNTSKDFLSSKLKILNLKIPLLRKYSLKEIKNFSEAELLEFLDYVWQKSEVSEVLNWVLIQSEKFSSDFLIKNQHVFLNWVNRVENWWHSDGLSSLYVKILELELMKDTQRKFSFPFLENLKKWNSDPNPWKRRQSVVSLLYYSRSRFTHLPYEELLKFVTTLLKDSEYYVQKGVGWTIREIYNLYPEETRKFLKANAEHISPHAWLASTEKLEKKFRAELNTIRRTKKRERITDGKK